MGVLPNCRTVVKLILALILISLNQSTSMGQGDKGINEARENPQENNLDNSSLKLTPKQADAIQVPMEAQGPIFEYGSTGSIVAPAVGRKSNAILQIFADGKIVVGGGTGIPKVESRLTDQELTEFLNFIVNENRFYELNSTDIRERMAKEKEMTILDANSSVFKLELQQGKHEVSVYALWNAVKSFPNFEEIQRLSAIEKRCTALTTKAHLGDRGEEVLKTVNEKVAELGLRLAPFTLQEMRLAARRANGRFQVSFQRALPDSLGQPGSPPKLMHAIYFVKDSDSKPQVTFYGLPKKN